MIDGPGHVPVEQLRQLGLEDLAPVARWELKIALSLYPPRFLGTLREALIAVQDGTPAW